MSLSVIQEVWLLEKSLGIYRLYYNGLKGNNSKWAVCRYSQNPACSSATTFNTKNRALLYLYSNVCANLALNNNMGMSKREQTQAFRKYEKSKNA